MRRLIFLLTLCGLSVSAVAQEQTLISGPIENGGFGGPVVKFSQVNDKFAVLVGGYGGWLINHTFMIGGGGFGLANEIRGLQAAQLLYGTGDNLRLQFGYGGLMLEYIGESAKLIHFYVSTLVGVGAVDYQYINGYQPYFDNSATASVVFVLEPSANVELNVSRFFRLGAGAGYRLVSGSNLVGVTDAGLSDLSFNLTFKFGKF